MTKKTMWFIKVIFLLFYTGNIFSQKMDECQRKLIDEVMDSTVKANNDLAKGYRLPFTHYVLPSLEHGLEGLSQSSVINLCNLDSFGLLFYYRFQDHNSSSYIFTDSDFVITYHFSDSLYYSADGSCTDAGELIINKEKKKELGFQLADFNKIKHSVFGNPRGTLAIVVVLVTKKEKNRCIKTFFDIQ